MFELERLRAQWAFEKASADKLEALARGLVDALEKAIRIAYLRDTRALYPSEEIALEECLKVHQQAKEVLGDE